ncbi:restriction endonuclease subunit S [Clostridioides difficile]
MNAETLRRSILQYAIQGKLVPQVDTEEPVNVLINKIKQEREILIREKKIKKERPLPRISDDEKPFEIPENWEWVRFSDIVTFNLGKTPDRKNSQFWDKGIYNWVSISDLNDKQTIYETKEKVSQIAFDRQFNNGLSKAGTLLMSFKLTIGKVSLLGCDAFHNEAIISIYPFIKNDIVKMYLFHTLCLLTRFVDSTDAIKGSTLNSTKMRSMLVPLPPLQEQKRIITRIEELMKLVGIYEIKQKELKTIEKEFPEKLKKSILQYAIQGKLVPQVDTEEPAIELLEKMEREKINLIKQGIIKKTKSIPIINEDEKAFDIPNSWEWVRMGSTLDIARGSSPRPIKKYITDEVDGINWIKIGDCIKGDKYINSTIQKIKPEGLYKSRYVKKGDFLLTNSMSFGRPYILNIDGCIHDGWLVLSDFSKIYFKEYLFYALTSHYVFTQFSNIVSGAVVNNLNIEKVSVTIIPLPPLEEQKRIVDKIEKIFYLIDLVHEGKKLKADDELKQENKTVEITSKDKTIKFNAKDLELVARLETGVTQKDLDIALKQIQEFYDEKN